MKLFDSSVGIKNIDLIQPLQTKGANKLRFSLCFFLFVDGNFEEVTADRNPASLGENVTLTCSTTVHFPTFSWELDGIALQTTSSNLSLPSVSATDGGSYLCLVSDGTSIFTPSLTLHVNPYFTTTPMNVSTSIGQTLSSTCQAEGFPAPVVSWAMVPDDGSSSVPVSATGLLQFVSITSSQFGTYRCTAVASDLFVTLQSSIDIVIASKILSCIIVHQNIC